MPKTRRKQSLKVKSFEKALTKNNDGSLKDLYVMKALVKGILKQVSEKQMDKNLVVFCSIKELDSVKFKWQWESLSSCVYRRVYMGE